MRAKGISGNLRAVGWPRIDDLRSPRGRGRGETGPRGRERRDRQGERAFARQPERLAAARPRSLPATARPSPSRAVMWSFSRPSAGAGLSHCWVAKPAHAMLNIAVWQGALPPLNPRPSARLPEQRAGCAVPEPSISTGGRRSGRRDSSRGSGVPFANCGRSQLHL